MVKSEHDIIAVLLVFYHCQLSIGNIMFNHKCTRNIPLTDRSHPGLHWQASIPGVSQGAAVVCELIQRIVGDGPHTPAWQNLL